MLLTLNVKERQKSDQMQGKILAWPPLTLNHQQLLCIYALALGFSNPEHFILNVVQQLPLSIGQSLILSDVLLLLIANFELESDDNLLIYHFSVEIHMTKQFSILDASVFLECTPVRWSLILRGGR